MAITDQNTVLVLGAGTSVPFGLSLGGDIIDELRTTLEGEKTRLAKHGFLGAVAERKMLNAANTVREYFDFAIYGSALRQYFVDEESIDRRNFKSDLVKLRDLSELLDGQTSETIDDFIVENPSFASLTKIGIAALFIQNCYVVGSDRLKPKPFESRHHPSDHNPPNRNWIHLLINIIRHGIHEEKVTPENKVKVITFNYDKVLEYVLDRQFGNTEATYAHYTNYIDIIHVHGECGNLVETKTPAQMCLEWANGIHVVNEPDVPDQVRASRATARELVQNAKELYFCGFSFSGPNCRLLGLDTPAPEVEARSISFCNYDGNIGISKTVNQFENKDTRTPFVAGTQIPRATQMGPQVFTDVTEASGTIKKPLSVTDWLRLGYLGELPG